MKRIYIKPESTLLEERYDTMLLAGSMGTNTTTYTGDNTDGPGSGGGGNGGEGGSDINGEARGGSLFYDDYDF